MNPSESSDLKKIIDEVFDRYLKEDYIHPDTLPNIDLYMDQVTHLLTTSLAKTQRYKEEKIMTKTMINNYTKNHLLPPPTKKKYNKDHILLLIFIYYFKSFLSISDVQCLLKPMADKYFGKSHKLDEIYEKLFSNEAELMTELRDQIDKQYDLAESIFADAPKEDQAYLHQFAWICLMSLDIYIKKQLIEETIDALMS